VGTLSRSMEMTTEVASLDSIELGYLLWYLAADIVTSFKL